MEQLKVKSSPSATEKIFPMTTDSFVVGRQTYCDLVLNNHTVSREHAKFVKKDGRWYIEDLQSRNGVWINGKRTGYEPVRLTDGDNILIGDVSLVFHTDAPSSSKSKEQRSNLEASSSRISDDVFDPKSIRSQYSVNGASSIVSDPDKVGCKTIAQYKREVKLLEERVRVFLEFAKILGKAEDSGDLTPRFLDGLLRIFPNAESASVCVQKPDADDPDNPQWTIMGHACRDDDDIDQCGVSRAALQFVADARVAVLSDSAPCDLRFNSSEGVATSQIRSVIAAPVYELGSDKLIAVIQIDSRVQKRRFTKDDLKLLVSVAGQIAVYWENQRQRDAIVAQKLAVQEMQLANQVQRGFLPLEPPKIESYEFFDYYLPAKYVGGDYFDYIPLSDGSLAIILGDVAGKGISASLLMAKLSSETRYSLALGKTRAETMRRLNAVFSENHWGGRFITLVMIILEPETGVVHIFNAGHLYPVVSKADGTVERVGKGFNSFPLGVVPNADFPEFVYSLKEGDAMSIMSDGFPDAQNVDEVAYGDDRIEHALRNPDMADATTLGRRLVHDMKRFSDSCPQTDDQCLVVFRRVPSNDSSGAMDVMVLSDSKSASK